MGADGVEIDVQLIDGELVIFHDSRLERTTDGRGRLRSKTFLQLRELDAGKGERIPTLAEICAAVGQRASINIELKGRGTAKPVAEFLEDLIIRQERLPEQFLISSFLRKELLEFNRLVPFKIPVGLLLSRPSHFWLRAAKKLGASSLHPPLSFTSRRLVEDAHKYGLKVYVYTVNHPKDLLRMQNLGVDGVFTDFPDRVISLQTEAD